MGAQVHKVTPSWRLSAILKDLQGQLCNMKGITFQAIRRKANKLADALENEGIDSNLAEYHSLWQDQKVGELKSNCHNIQQSDLQAQA